VDTIASPRHRDIFQIALFGIGRELRPERNHKEADAPVC
jgi:hypothetical protein